MSGRFRPGRSRVRAAVALAGAAAVVSSCVIGLILAGVIAYLRPGGWTEWIQTYGVLICVGAIATLAGRLT